MGYPNQAGTRSRQEGQGDLRRLVREELALLLKNPLEKLQAMTGERGPDDGSLKAVRRGDLARIGAVALGSAHAAGATPSAAEFNALVDDVKTLAGLIERIGQAFSG